MARRTGVRVASIGTVVGLLAALGVLAVAGGADAGNPTTRVRPGADGAEYRAPAADPARPGHRGHHAVCGTASPGFARCVAEVVDPESGSRPAAGPAATSLGPSALQTAYGFPGTTNGGQGETIAIVDAYDDPNISADLATFDAQYNLSCNSCFSEYVEGGVTPNAGWALEISLDVEWAHAMAPAAHIDLIEATDSGIDNLFSGVQFAAAPTSLGGLGAQYVSMSWIGGEWSTESSYDSSFVPGVTFFAASGDYGAGTGYPAVSPDVISVGGTTLTMTNGAFTSETAWSGSGGGCSTYESAAAAQLTNALASSDCHGRRAMPDVAADGDPNTGVAVYDSYQSSGWNQVGGTSVATPVWAAESADAAATITARTVYTSSAIAFRDITTGSNGAYTAGPGYDLVTGLGSWATTQVAVAAPAPPVNVTATGGTGQATVSWSPGTGGGPVQSYTVARSTSSGGPFTNIATVAASPYTDTGLAAGTYYYTVTATNSGGSATTPAAGPATVATLGQPGAPTLVTATPGLGQVALTWTAPTTGGAVQTYVVDRDGAQIASLGSSALTYTDANLTAGISHTYNVNAVNASGSMSSNSLSATPYDGPPTASISKSCSSARCTFTSTSTDAHGTITSWTWGGSVSGTTGSVSHSYTTAGTYQVTLKVTNNTGLSASTNTSVTCTSGRRSRLTCR